MANIFTAIYDVFLSLGYFWMITIVSLLITIITTLVYKYTTDQKRLKEIKKEMKTLQEKQKKHRNDPKKVNEITKEMFAKNSEIMKQSFKSMIYTIVPLLFLFSWLSATMAFQPIMPGENFTVTAVVSPNYPGNISDIKLSSIPSMTGEKNYTHNVTNSKGTEIQWILNAPKNGTYTILIEGETFKQTKEILVTTEKKYLNPVSLYSDSQLQGITIGNKPVRPLGENFSILGWKPGWLGLYIILSLIISTILRKVLKIA